MLRENRSKDRDTLGFGFAGSLAESVWATRAHAHAGNDQVGAAKGGLHGSPSTIRKPYTVSETVTHHRQLLSETRLLPGQACCCTAGEVVVVRVFLRLHIQTARTVDWVFYGEAQKNLSRANLLFYSTGLLTSSI